MTSLNVGIKAWAAWAPDRATHTDWLSWAGCADPVDAPAPAPVSPPPQLLRRRVSPLGQKALGAAWGLPEAAGARLVFASRHGEFRRTLSIMNSLAEDQDVSPADFTLSVHHALAGLLSIAGGNRGGHTAVAAGIETFCYGLMEAACCLAEQPDQPVVLVYYDEPLPEPFDRFDEAEAETLALALSLGADGSDSGIRLATTPVPGGATPTRRPGEAFLRFLLGDAERTTIIGERLAWHLEKAHAAAP